jgi:hypothetical protein
MKRTFSLRASLLAVALLTALALPARAQTNTQYVVRGPVAAVIWGLDQGAIDFDLTVLASSDIAPAVGAEPAPGPRIAFSLMRLSSLGGTLIRRYWYGSAALPLDALSISPDLSGATLNVEVDGTRGERIGDGAVKESVVKGRIEIKWVANAAAANTTLSLNNQTQPFPVQFDAVGQGRAATATVKITVDGLGGPLDVTGPGTLLSVASGLLTLKAQ